MKMLANEWRKLMQFSGPITVSNIDIRVQMSRIVQCTVILQMKHGVQLNRNAYKYVWNCLTKLVTKLTLQMPHGVQLNRDSNPWSYHFENTRFGKVVIMEG